MTLEELAARVQKLEAENAYFREAQAIAKGLRSALAEKRIVNEHTIGFWCNDHTNRIGAAVAAKQ